MENRNKRSREFQQTFYYPKRERIEIIEKLQKKKERVTTEKKEKEKMTTEEKEEKKKTESVVENQKKEIEILKIKIDNLNDKLDLIVDHVSKINIENSIEKIEKIKLDDCNYIS